MKIRRGAQRPRPPKPASAWKLWRASMTEMRLHWKRYIGVLAVISVPLNLFNLSTTFSQDATFGAYAQVLSVIMNVALVWAIVETERTGTAPKVGEAYHRGSLAIVRFAISTLILVLMLVPAAFAAAIYIAAFMVAGNSGSPGEQIILIFVCLLIASVSGWWMVRFALAPTITVASDMRPMAALRHSRRLTLGRFWRVGSRYAALFAFIMLLAAPIAIVTALLALLKLGSIPTLFFGLVTTFTALPLINMYLLKLYRSLEHGPEVKTVDEAA